MKKERSYKIYLILADENLFHPHYLLGMLESFNEKNYKVCGITIAKDNYRHGFLSAVHDQINLWSFFPFTFIALNSLSRTFFSRFISANKFTIEGIARRYNIPVISSINVNSPEHIKYLSKQKVDVIISSNGQIFRQELLRLPKIACINRHTALLPKYGGVVPVFWAMKNSEKELGVSAHLMVEKIDQGDILSSESFKNENDSSLFHNYMIAFDISIDVTRKAIENALNKKIEKKFKHNKDEYYSFPKRSDIKDFKKNNKTFVTRDIAMFYKMYF